MALNRIYPGSPGSTNMDPYYLSPAEEKEMAIDERRRLMQALDGAHTALRMVDASNTTIPQLDKTLEAVSDAVAAVERIARELDHKLPEFFPQPQSGRSLADPEAEIRRLCGCLLVIAGAEGCGNGALRTAAYEAASMNRTVQDLQIRLGVPVPWIDLRSAVIGGEVC